MPKVGTGKSARSFPYTKKGERAAKLFGKKTGQPVKMAGKY